jgi:hypothetical protein
MDVPRRASERWNLYRAARNNKLGNDGELVV